MSHQADDDRVWKALADPTRRAILDFLRDGPRRTGDIVGHIEGLSRVGVLKHLEVLREVDLVLTRKEGRTRINRLNAGPIRAIYERWVRGFQDHWAGVLGGIAAPNGDDKSK